MDYFNLSTLIHELKEKVENVENKLEDIEYEIVLMKNNKK
jgi:hypothetical protein